MHFIKIFKDYYNEVLIPCWKWMGEYWKEYFAFAVVIVGVTWLYYTCLFDY